MFKTQLTDQLPTETEEALTSECILAPNRMGHPEEFAHIVQTIVTNPYINATTIDLSAGLDMSMTA